MLAGMDAKALRRAPLITLRRARSESASRRNGSCVTIVPLTLRTPRTLECTGSESPCRSSGPYGQRPCSEHARVLNARRGPPCVHKYGRNQCGPRGPAAPPVSAELPVSGHRQDVYGLLTRDPQQRARHENAGSSLTQQGCWQTTQA